MAVPYKNTLLAGRKQTRVDVPRILRLTDRWMREWYRKRAKDKTDPHIDGSRVFYIWIHRGYSDTESMLWVAETALRENDNLAFIIAMLVAGMSATQRSKIVNEFTRRCYEKGKNEAISFYSKKLHGV